MSAAPAFRDSAATAEAAQAQLLYERYAAQVQRFCHARLRSREEAEDAVQHTFLNAYRSLRQGTVPRAEAAWVFAIAANVCRERRRAAWRRSRVEAVSDDGLVAECAAPEREPENLAGLADALSALTANQRRAILMREWQGLSYREIAGELGVSEAAVETLLFRARRALTRMRGRVWGWTNLGSVLAWGKTLLSGGTAQLAAATLAVTAGVTAATPLLHHSARHATPTAAAAKPAAASRTASASPVSSTERRSAPASARARAHAQRGRSTQPGATRARPQSPATASTGGALDKTPPASGPLAASEPSPGATAKPSGGEHAAPPAAPAPPPPPAVEIPPVEVPPVQVGPVQTPPVQTPPVQVPLPPLPPPLPQLPQLPPVTLPQLPSVQLPPPPPLP
jgi:RNA polymerase sigma factor (sigma-70 family)